MKRFFKDKLYYEIWANNRIFTSLLTTQYEDERINWLMSHILAARVVWFERIKGISISEAIWTPQPLSACAALNDKINESYLNFMDELQDADFTKVIRYRNLKGEAFSNTLEEILFHVFNHSSYHRGQIVSRIKELSFPPPVTDYIVFSRMQ